MTRAVMAARPSPEESWPPRPSPRAVPVPLEERNAGTATIMPLVTLKPPAASLQKPMTRALKGVAHIELETRKL